MCCPLSNQPHKIPDYPCDLFSFLIFLFTSIGLPFYFPTFCFSLLLCRLHLYGSERRTRSRNVNYIPTTLLCAGMGGQLQQALLSSFPSPFLLFRLRFGEDISLCEDGRRREGERCYGPSGWSGTLLGVGTLLSIGGFLFLSILS